MTKQPNTRSRRRFALQTLALLAGLGTLPACGARRRTRRRMRRRDRRGDRREDRREDRRDWLFDDE